MTKVTRLDAFNIISAYIFAGCVKEHPLHFEICLKLMSENLNIEKPVCDHTVSWLRENSYIRVENQRIEELYKDNQRDGINIFVGCRLTDKGMVAIQKAGELLKFSVGDEMRKHIDESRTPANLSSLGELIGGIFGGAVKTLGS